MLDTVGYAVAALMTTVALWRLPSAIWGDAQRRALWGCYAGFAAALWLKTAAVRTALNSSPITDLSVLLKHYVSTAAILSILGYIVAMYGKHDDTKTVPRHVADARVVARIANKAALAAMVVMTVLFFTIVDRSSPSDRFVADHTGQLGATAYMTVFYLFLGAASAVCAYQWTSQTRRASGTGLRTGLGMMSAAMWIGVAYVASRTAFMWASLMTRPSHGFTHGFEATTEGMQLGLFTLFAIGASLPASSIAARRIRHWRALYRLYPLWRELMDAFPAIPFDPPASRLREVTRLDAPVAVRLDRWVHDIADAIDKLRHFVNDQLLLDASCGMEWFPPAEAYWIRTALQAKANGAPRGHAAAFTTQPSGNLDDRVAWLLKVNDAYQDISRAQKGPANRELEGRRTNMARVVTDVLQPRNVLLVGLAGIGAAASNDPLTGITWGLFAALCAGVVPASYIEWERRRGTWGDRHVVDRRQRPRIFAVILASIGVGTCTMPLGHAPTDLQIAMIALWAMTVGLLTVNTAWKISVDSAVASAVVAMLATVQSPWWLLAYTVVAAVCWSRVALKFHSVAQTVAGASLGAVTAGMFAVL